MNALRLSLLCGTLFAVRLAHGETAHGVMRVVKGEVQIQVSGQGALARARLGMQISPHDVILTGKESRAKVVMSDGNELNISPDSRVEIQTYEYNPGQGKKNVLLNVIYGKVRAKVEQHYDGKTSHFLVKTPSAVAGVRGTDFITSFERETNNSLVVTFRGAVDFGLPGANGEIANAVSVTPGKMASSVAGQAPAPAVALPKEQLKQLEKESYAEAGGANQSAKNQRDEGRSLASVNSAGMMRPEDLPAAGGALPPPVAFPINVAHPPAPSPVAQPCTTCNALIQNGGNANLNVHIK